MLVDLIDSFDALDGIADTWDSVYLADPHARYFLSFPFLRRWLSSLNGEWFVLAAKPARDAAYQAFLPLRLRSYARPDGQIVSDLLMAGNYGSDYTGLVALPHTSDASIPAFAQALQLLHWQAIKLDYVPAADDRYRQLLAHFRSATFAIRRETRTNKRDNVDNLVCPVADLQGGWEAYLSTLSSNTRQKLRRLLRQYESDPELEITEPAADTIQADIIEMMRLWMNKWSERKGPQRARSIVATNGRMLLDAFRAGELYMPILRRNDRLVAALATFVDPLKHAAHFYMTGRDETFDGPSPGLLLHAYSMRSLIGRGVVVYDFLRGNEPYKATFENRREQLMCVSVATRNGLNLGGRLEQRTLPTALVIATRAHRSGEFRKAAVGYGQILAVDPKRVDALYRYGRLLQAMGKASSARKLLAAARAASEGDRAAEIDEPA